MRPSLLLTCALPLVLNGWLAAAGSEIPAPKTDDELIDAMRRAFRESYQNKHERDVLRLLDSLTPQNAERVQKLFDEFNEDGLRRDFAWGAYWRKRGEIAGQATLESFIAGNDPHSGYWHYEAVMAGWASVDPDGAEKWLRAHTEVKHFWALYQRVVAALAPIDADRATHLVFDLGKDPKYVADALGVLTDTLRLVYGTARIADWFETLNDSGKQAAMIHAAYRIKDGDLQFAAKWFAAQLDKPWRDDRHFYPFVDRYVDTDPVAAMNWLAGLSPNTKEGSGLGMRPGVKRWALKNRAAADTWLNQHKEEKWWARGAAGYYQALRQNSPREAETFLNDLGAERRESVERELKQ